MVDDAFINIFTDLQPYRLYACRYDVFPSNETQRCANLLLFHYSCTRSYVIHIKNIGFTVHELKELAKLQLGIENIDAMVRNELAPEYMLMIEVILQIHAYLYIEFIPNKHL